MMYIHVVCLRDNYYCFKDFVVAMTQDYNIDIIFHDKTKIFTPSKNHIYIFCNKIPNYHVLSNDYKTILMNTEQLSRNDFTITYDVKNAINDNIMVIDYDLYQTQIFPSINHIYIPYLYNDNEVKRLTQIYERTPKIYDVAFCAVGLSKRRKQICNKLRSRGVKVYDVVCWDTYKRDAMIAKAKILINIHYNSKFKIYEHYRCDRWIPSGMLVVTEESYSDNLLDVKDLLYINNIDTIVEYTINILNNYDRIVIEHAAKVKQLMPNIINNRNLIYKNFISHLESINNQI
jgi:hypothetical protein